MKLNISRIFSLSMFLMILSCQKPTTLIFKIKNDSTELVDSISIMKNDDLPKKIISLKPGQSFDYKLEVEKFEYKNQHFKLKCKIHNQNTEDIWGYYLTEKKASRKLNITFEGNSITYDF